MSGSVMKRIPDAVAQRALARFVFDPVTGCHVSTYSVASHGYAQIGWKRQRDYQARKAAGLVGSR